MDFRGAGDTFLSLQLWKLCPGFFFGGFPVFAKNCSMGVWYPCIFSFIHEMYRYTMI